MARAGAQAAIEETIDLKLQVLEIAIALIIGFALRYGVRAWIFPSIRNSSDADLLIKGRRPRV